MGDDDLDLLHVGHHRGDDHRRRRVIGCDCAVDRVPLPGGFRHATRCVLAQPMRIRTPRPGPVLVAHPGTPIALIVGSGGWSADAVGTTKVYAAQGVAVAAAVVAVGLYRGVSVAKHVSVGLGSLGSGSRSRTVNR